MSQEKDVLIAILRLVGVTGNVNAVIKQAGMAENIVGYTLILEAKMMEQDLEYWQLRLYQLLKYLKNSNYNWPYIRQEVICQDIIKDIQHCRRKIEQRYKKEVLLCKENEVMY